MTFKICTEKACLLDHHHDQQKEATHDNKEGGGL